MGATFFVNSLICIFTLIKEKKVLRRLLHFVGLDRFLFSFKYYFLKYREIFKFYDNKFCSFIIKIWFLSIAISSICLLYVPFEQFMSNVLLSCMFQFQRLFLFYFPCIVIHKCQLMMKRLCACFCHLIEILKFLLFYSRRMIYFKIF